MLSEDEQERYIRQIMMIGEDGQERLKQATIFIAGAGGLGSPIGLYLAAAGVGRLILADYDTVDLSNLNRQVLHGTADLGRRKVDSARRKLEAINPEITIETESVTIDDNNLPELVGDADGIVDAMDNFGTRYLLNRAALQKEIPFFHGGINGFSGQATTIVPGTTACLRCIFPHPPPQETFPVLGTTAGFIGVVQANEVLRYLLGRGELLTNRLLLWDGERAKVDEIAVEQNPSCSDCGRR
ncbi:MAG: HesA/MoeB/ThiF family protein [Methanocalculus sp. MSAO_Arc1]|uniref:HesA/MoeB/ThiF family protein n=1 Tax=Methanocalculus TaxID=71151 RepID=UPI000FF02AC1|nr:HesA/MoeB/ThiF family protein [Methanocalculus sp. MSAO_Arc1]MCP1661350.1 adenylyltransferase/sulfurtransferase [Methanocalculus sp. AMF5]RQD82103.1 MAG: HesA/MoeB/ThiF family protein [Methanocalculus sp. MSAO_Arc1]